MIDGEVESAELTKLRGEGHASKTYIAGLDAPAVVFRARISQTFGTLDRIGDVQYDGALGSYEAVRVGQTVLFGTTSGGRDIGKGRIRKLAESDTLYIGETSELALDNDQHITVIEEYLPWAIPMHVDDDGELCADYDIPFTDQYDDFEPVPVMGPDWVVSPPRTPVSPVLNDTNEFITYTGAHWYHNTPVYAAYGGDVHLNSTADEYAEFTFYGSRVKWMATTGDDGGYADVYIDNVFDETVSLYTATTLYQQWVYDKTLTEGEHTLKIVCRGAGEGGVWYRKRIDIDALSYDGIDLEVTIEPDASASWCFESTIASYGWEAPGSLSSSDMGTATPSITYDTAGTYHIYCTVIAANGKETTGVRRVYVVFEPTTINTNGVIIDPSDGGASFTIEAYDNASTVTDGARVILWSEDWYNGVAGSIGSVVDHENIIACGWIDGEGIQRNVDGSSVRFSVRGLGRFMDSIALMPASLDLATNNPQAWHEMPAMTVDRGLFFALHYLSNITRITDVYLTDDTRLVKKLESTERSLWGILQTFGEKIGALPFVSALDTLQVAIDPQLIPEADRDWPTVMTLGSSDIVNPLDAEKVTTLDVSQIDISGRHCNSSGREKSYYSLAYGHVPGVTGSPITSDTWITDDQAQLNQLAGLLNGWRNNPYPDLTIGLGGNYRVFDCMPYSFVGISLTADLRGAMQFNLIPRAVQYQFTDGGIITTLEAEAETFETLNTNGDIPGVDEDFSDPPTPKFPPFPPFPPGGDLSARPKKILIKDATRGFLYTENGDDPDPTKVRWEFVNGGLTEEGYKEVVSDVFVTSYGKVYLAYRNVFSGIWNELWCADYIGGIFRKLIDEDWLRAAVGADPENSVGMSAISMNTLADDQLAFFAGERLGPPEYMDGALFVGNSGGWSAGENIVDVQGGNNTGGLSFGSGVWKLTSVRKSVFSSPSMWTFSQSGVQIGEKLDYDLISPQPGIIQARAGSTNIFYLVNSTSIYRVVGDTFTETGGGVYGDGSNFYNLWYMDVEPSSQYLMLANTTGLGLKSSDFGTTWSSLGAVLPLGIRAFGWAKYDTLRWVAAGGAVYFTEDFGDTWVDMSGNLSYVCTLPNIKYIKVIE